MPFDPEVFGNASSPRCSNASRSCRATSAHSTIVAGGPGSRSKATIVGAVTSVASASEVCSSRSARLASHTSVARSSARQKSIVRALWRLPSARGEAQSGGWAAPDRRGDDPVGAVARALLLVEVGAADPVGIALERQRPPAQVRQQDRRDARVVVDHLPLGEPRLGIEDLVEVREGQPPPVDVDLQALGHATRRYPFVRRGRTRVWVGGDEVRPAPWPRNPRSIPTTPRRPRPAAPWSSSTCRRRTPPSRPWSPTSAPTSR